MCSQGQRFPERLTVTAPYNIRLAAKAVKPPIKRAYHGASRVGWPISPDQVGVVPTKPIFWRPFPSGDLGLKQWSITLRKLFKRRGSIMPAIFDLLYREYCRARLAETRKQLLIRPVSHEGLEANCDFSRPSGFAGRDSGFGDDRTATQREARYIH